MHEVLARVAPVMAKQQALATTAQILQGGGNHELASSYVHRGIWERVDRGLYGPAGVPMTWRRQLMAAVLLGPGGTLVSHRAGAAIQGVGGLVEPMPEVSIPQGASFRRTGVIVHESVDLGLAEPLSIDGIPVTGPARLAMDVGSVMSTKRFRNTMREIQHVLGVDAETLLRTYLRHRRQGRNGGGALRDWLDRYHGVAGIPESGLEQLVLDAIIDAGLAVPRLQVWVETRYGRFRIDLAYPDLMLAIEVDGSQHRDDDEIRASDVVRARALRALGWKVHRVRSWSFASDLDLLMVVLRRELARSPVSCSEGR